MSILNNDGLTADHLKILQCQGYLPEAEHDMGEEGRGYVQQRVITEMTGVQAETTWAEDEDAQEAGKSDRFQESTDEVQLYSPSFPSWWCLKQDRRLGRDVVVGPCQAEMSGTLTIPIYGPPHSEPIDRTHMMDIQVTTSDAARAQLHASTKRIMKLYRSADWRNTRGFSIGSESADQPFLGQETYSQRLGLVSMVPS